LHEKKARFNHKENRSPVHIAYGKDYNGDCKKVWMPVKHAELNLVKSPENLDAAHGLKLGGHESAEGVVSNPKTSGIDGVGCGSVHRKGVDTEGKHATAASSSISASEKNKSVNMQTDSASKGIASGTSMRLQIGGLKSSTSTSTQRWSLRNRGNQRAKDRSASDQQGVFSAKEKIFAHKQQKLITGRKN
jgi:hypothetical protein